MKRNLPLTCSLTAVVALLAIAAFATGKTSEQPSTPAAAYEQDGRMRFPSHYREWVYLSSGFDMAYSSASRAPESPSLFDNVFVDPAAYRTFQQTGEWPDGAVLVLEVRNAQNKGSINKGGHFQASLNHFEAHVKDSTRFPGKWAFFGFEGEKSGSLIPQSASCYSCHQDHAAVDTTFVQFYPTLLPIAERSGKISQAYLKELSAQQTVSK